jgi:hypothetical protein
MTGLPAIRQTMMTSWLTTQHLAARAVLWSTRHPFVSLGLLYGMLMYFSLAVLIGVPGRAIVALMIVGPLAWWCFGRYEAWAEPRTSRLSFFTWDNGPLRLSEDIGSSKIVYCVGVKNEGTRTAGSVRVNIDSVAGYAPPPSGASLPIFRNPENSVSLQPNESEYFCVMRRMDGASPDDGTVAICCHDNLITPSFGIQELADGRTITLSVHSEGTHGTTRQIQISSNSAADATWSLQMSLLPDTDETPVQAPEQRSVAAGAREVREAWNRVTARLGRLGELSIAERCKKAFARETSERPELPQEPIKHAATGGEYIAAEVQAAKDTPLDQGGEIGDIAREPPAQSERIRRLLAGQARA